jgi:hypothetical protein
MFERPTRDGLLGNRNRGVVFGLVPRVPASGLTVTYMGGLVNVDSGNATVPVVEKVVAGATIAITASKDAYLYVSSAGTLSKLEVANGAAKPTYADIGTGSEFIAKCVSNGTDVTAVTDLRRYAARGNVVVLPIKIGFLTAEQGAQYVLAPSAGRIIALAGSVNTALGATDTGTVTYAIGDEDVFVNITTGVLTFAISAPVGTRVEAFPTALNAIKQGQYLRATSLKTTTGGEVNAYAYLLCER